MPTNPSPLKRILLAQGRRQTWLAQRAGIDPADLSRIVNRGLIPSEKVRDAIADALDVKPADLWPDLYAEAGSLATQPEIGTPLSVNGSGAGVSA